MNDCSLTPALLCELEPAAAAPERLLALGLLKIDEEADGLNSGGGGPGGEVTDEDEADDGEVRDGEVGDMTVRPSTSVCKPVVLLTLVLMVVLLGMSAGLGGGVGGGAPRGALVGGGFF